MVVKGGGTWLSPFWPVIPRSWATVAGGRKSQKHWSRDATPSWGLTEYITRLLTNRATKAVSGSGCHIHKGPEICLHTQSRWANSVCTLSASGELCREWSHISSIRTQSLLRSGPFQAPQYQPHDDASRQAGSHLTSQSVFIKTVWSPVLSLICEFPTWRGYTRLMVSGTIPINRRWKERSVRSHPACLLGIQAGGFGDVLIC